MTFVCVGETGSPYPGYGSAGVIAAQVKPVITERCTGIPRSSSLMLERFCQFPQLAALAAVIRLAMVAFGSWQDAHCKVACPSSPFAVISWCNLCRCRQVH